MVPVSSGIWDPLLDLPDRTALGHAYRFGVLSLAERTAGGEVLQAPPRLCIGDRLRIGSAVLMVTQPRMPCYKLALRFDRDDMIKRFLVSGRSGFYFSVIEPGEVTVG